MPDWAIYIIVVVLVGVLIGVGWSLRLARQRRAKNYERGLKMIPMLIHLPPSTDDIQGNGRDERDVTNEALSQAQVMYSIIASTVTKGMKSRIFGQRHMAFEIVATDGLIKYYAVVPAVIVETVKQAVISAYPSARLEEIEPDSIFSEDVTTDQVAGGEMTLKKDFVLPISTYEDSQRDASLGILNAMSVTKAGEGIAVQILLRPTDGSWTKKSEEWVQNLKNGKKMAEAGKKAANEIVLLVKDFIQAFWRPPDEHEKYEKDPLTNLQQEQISAIENKTKYPGFETLIRVVASSKTKERSEAMLGGVVAAFAQFLSLIHI